MNGRTSKATCAAVLVVLAIMMPPPAAGIIYVDNDNPADFNNIQAAIDDSNDGDVVIVAPGAYTGDGNRDIDFMGKAVILRSVDPNDPNIVAATIIDCNGTEAEPHRAFYFHSNEDSNSVVSGLTIINGCESSGAAVFCERGSPVIANCLIRDNFGIAIGCEYGGCRIVNCIIENNGGNTAVVLENHASIAGSLIRNNLTTAVGAYDASTVTNCVIINNPSTGLSIGDGATAQSCLIEGNGDRGIMCTGKPTISGCTIRGNLATSGAGLYCRWWSAPVVRDCVISDNFAVYEGGGIYCGGENTLLTNCVVAGNSAANRGGGIYIGGSSACLTNCIVWGNTAHIGPQIALPANGGYGSASLGCCAVEGGRSGVFVDVNSTLDWGGGMIEQDPGFAFAGDYHLAADSPCIDAGSNAPAGGLGDVDPDGNMRRLDGNADHVSVVDIGAYEFNAARPSIAASRSSIELFVEEGAQRTESILSVRNCGGGTLKWDITDDSNRLEAAPASGQSDGRVDNVVLDFNTAGLGHGDYNCVLTVTGRETTNGPLSVDLVVHVNTTLRVPSEFSTIQAAIDAAIDGDVVLVADGQYTGAGNSDIEIRNKAVTVTSENGPDNCIIDCRHRARAFYIDMKDPGKNAVINGLSVTNGFDEEYGGGIVLRGYGGAIISNCTIENCAGACGAVFCSSANLTLVNCAVTGNRGLHTDPYRAPAAGINSIQGTSLIDNCTFTYNRDGAALISTRGIARITDCRITDNSGGAIQLFLDSSAVVGNCLISANTAPEDRPGAGIWCDFSDCVVANTVIAGNTSSAYGGGICSRSYSSAAITNCVIVGNKGGSGGGAICVEGDSDATIENSIIRGNFANFGPQIALGYYYWDQGDRSTLTARYCDVETGQEGVCVEPNCMLDWGPGNIDVDPLFAEAGYWDPNGTYYYRFDDFWVDGDYHLKSEVGRWDPAGQTWIADAITSPCIDAGDPTMRCTDELWPSGMRINMGAYGGAAQASMSSDITGDIADLNGDGFVTNNDLAIFVDRWLAHGLPLKQDFTRDGSVGFEDFALFARNWWIPPPPGQASDPSPTNGANEVSTAAKLSWTPGSNAVLHDVYFGSGLPLTFCTTTIAAKFDPGPLAEDTTYYWRIDPVNPTGTTTGTVWRFTTKAPEPPPSPPGQTSDPFPAHGATNVSTTVQLSWTAGSNTASYNVYFGTIGSGAFRGNQVDTTFEPGQLAYGTTYYWRIDSVGPGGTTTGPLWWFATIR